MTRCFIGSYSNENLAINHPNISQAAFYFQHNFVNAIKASETIWIFPLNLFRTNLAAYSTFQSDEQECKSAWKKFINTIFKLLFSTHPVVQQLAHQLMVSMPRSTNIWIYNSEFNNFLYIIRLFLAGKKLYIVLADTSPSGIHFLFTNIGLILCKSYISLSSKGLLIKPRKKPMLIHGICKINTPSNDSMSISINSLRFAYPHLFCMLKNDKFFVIIFSGSVGIPTGLDVVLSAASQLKNTIIIITGKPYQMTTDQIISRVKKFPNVYFLGMLPLSIYHYILSNSHLALSLRDFKDEHLYNFPSKIIEFLAYGLPVITTIDYALPSPPVITCKKYSANSLLEAIRTAQSYPRSMLKTLSIQLSKRFSSDILFKVASDMELRA